MFITNASRRRFLMAQKQLNENVPDKLWNRYVIYCDHCEGFPITFTQWLKD